MFLEIGNDRYRNRNQNENIHGQMRIDPHHDDKDKQQIGTVPYNVHQTP